mmetsp:Transcript_9844/g.29260  ORF Transcript_9844/g.29260 Transcript_9844/m.29260 type:complete len:313 (-) Transcript_9844:228-1166(-)
MHYEKPPPLRKARPSGFLRWTSPLSSMPACRSRSDANAILWADRMPSAFPDFCSARLPIPAASDPIPTEASSIDAPTSFRVCCMRMPAPACSSLAAHNRVGPTHATRLSSNTPSLSASASRTARSSLSVASARQAAASRSSSMTNSFPVLNRQLAPAWARASPALRIWAPALERAPPYRSRALVKSMRSSPLRARALPESISGPAAGLRTEDPGGAMWRRTRTRLWFLLMLLLLLLMLVKHGRCPCPCRWRIRCRLATTLAWPWLAKAPTKEEEEDNEYDDDDDDDDRIASSIAAIRGSRLTANVDCRLGFP